MNDNIYFKFKSKIVEYEEYIIERNSVIGKNERRRFSAKLDYYLSIISDFSISDMTKYPGIKVLSNSGGIFRLDIKTQKNIRVLITVRCMTDKIETLNKEISLISCFFEDGGKINTNSYMKNIELANERIEKRIKNE